MTNRSLRIPLVLAALLAAMTLAACGSSSTPVTDGDGEAVNVQAGNLVYQVQVSRGLNPRSVEDGQYLEGVDPADATLPNGDLWFAVFMRVQNTTDTPHQATAGFKVRDAEGNEYSPIGIADSNPFKYSDRMIEEAGGNGQPLLPDPDSASGSGPIQGSMLLFKVPYSIYANSPVELEITPTEGGEPSRVHLDM